MVDIAPKRLPVAHPRVRAEPVARAETTERTLKSERKTPNNLPETRTNTEKSEQIRTLNRTILSAQRQIERIRAKFDRISLNSAEGLRHAG